MSGSPRRRPAESPSCPLLGLPDDPLTRFSYPSVAHRCRATDRPRPIELGHQAAFCLAATYPDCPRYQAATAPEQSGAITTVEPLGKPGTGKSMDNPGTSGIPSTSGIPGTSGIPTTPARPAMPWTLARPGRPASPNPVNAPAPPDRPEGTDPPKAIRARGAVGVVIAIAVLTMLAGAAYLASPAIGDWVRQVGASAPSAGPSPVVARSSTPVPTLTTPLPDPSRTPDQSPAAAPTPTPTRAAAPIIHVVARGEYLIRIAARYGVSVEAIIRANGLTDPGLIYVGERLIIPPP